MAGRIAKPWYSDTRSGGGWFVWIKGRQTFLGKHEDTKKPNPNKPPKAILDEWHRQMSLDKPETQADYRFAELVAHHLDAKPNPEKKAMLKTLCEFKVNERRIGDRLVNAELEADHLQAFLDHRDGTDDPWTVNTKHTYAAHAKSVINWAIKRPKRFNVHGNPFNGIELPAPQPRQATISEKHHKALCDFWKKRDDKNGRGRMGFIDLLHALWHTGARPSELYNLTAEDVDLEQDVATVWEHKGQKKTGAPRLVPINAELRLILVRLCETYPQGPLFRGWWGQRFNNQSVHVRFQTAQDEGIIPEEIVPYCYRHSFATDALTSGLDIYSVGKVLGHQTASTTARQYDKSRRNVKHLTDIVSRVRRR